MGGNICVEGKPPQGPPSPKGAVEAPKSFAPEDIKQAGVDIVKNAKMGVDKPNVTMRADQPSTVQVVFTNGVAGEIQIGLDGPSVRDSFLQIVPDFRNVHGLKIKSASRLAIDLPSAGRRQ
jgi:hypothetical protein